VCDFNAVGGGFPFLKRKCREERKKEKFPGVLGN
jgi:hypothetical protein